MKDIKVYYVKSVIYFLGGLKLKVENVKNVNQKKFLILKFQFYLLGLQAY